MADSGNHAKHIRAISADPSAFDRLPPGPQAQAVAQLFAKAKSLEAFREANAIWEHVKPGIAKSEAGISCSDYSNGDMDLALSIVDDLAAKPVKLIIATLTFLYEFGGCDDEATVKALRELRDELRDKAVDQTGELIGEYAAKQFRKRIGDRLRELLLKYLQSVSKRSRRYFNEVLDNLFGIVRGVGGGVVIAGKIIFKPSKIAPDWCGMMELVEAERSKAFQRIFGMSIEKTGPHPVQWSLLPPARTGPRLDGPLLGR